MKKLKKFWVDVGIVFGVIVIIAGALLIVFRTKVFQKQTDFENLSFGYGHFENLPSEDEVFAKFTESYWKNISFSEIESICDEISILISYDLDLIDEVEIDIIYDKDVAFFGRHYRNTNLIEINLYQIYRDKKPYTRIVKTLAHELRHHYQEQRVNQGFNTKLEQSFQNYITSKQGYDLYYNQFCEVDARNFGEYWENLLLKWQVA